MHCGTFHEEDGASAVADKLVEDFLLVVVLSALERGERTHADEVAILCHDGDGFEQVFALVAVHDDTALRFEFPRTLIDVEHDDVHAEVHRCLLGGEACAQTVVEEDEQGGLVAAQVLILESVVFDFLCLGQRRVQVAEVLYVLEYFHLYFFFFFFANCP